MAFDIEGARKAGYSNGEIAGFLSKQSGFDVDSAKKAGYSDEEILGHLSKAKPKEPEIAKPAGFSAKETAAALGQGIIGAGKSLTDVFGADNAASKFLEEQNRALEGTYSPERKAEMAQRQAKITEAEKSGSLTKEIGAYLGTIADAPVQSLAQGLGSIVPYIGTGIVGGLAKLGGATVKALNTVVGAAQGAGTIKGSVYDAVRDELEKSGMKPSEAAEKASKAQEYLGPNALQIMAGTALGGVAARFGVENLLQKGAADKLNAKLAPRVLTAAGAEAPLEGLQGGQEQLAKNLALKEAGFDVPAMQGVFGSAFRDAALGALTAGAVGAVQSPSAKTTVGETGQQEVTPPVTPPTTTAATTETPTGYVPKFDMEGNPIAQAIKAEDLLPDSEPLKGEPTNVQPIDTTTTGTSAETLGEPGTDATSAGITPIDQGRVDVADNVLKGVEAGTSAKPAALNEVVEPIAEAKPTKIEPIEAAPTIIKRVSPVPQIIADPIERTEKSYISRIERDNPNKEVDLNDEILRYVAMDITFDTNTRQANSLYKTLDDVDKAKVEQYKVEFNLKNKKGSAAWNKLDREARLKDAEQAIKGTVKGKDENLNTFGFEDEDIAPIEKAVSGASTNNLINYATSGSTAKTLREIADNKDSFTPLENLIAKRMLSNNYLSIPKMQVVPRDQVPAKQEDGTGADGAYDSRNDTIYIAQGQVDSHSILHEATHSFLHSLILAFERGQTTNKGLKDLQDIYNYVKQVAPQLVTSKEYGMQSLTEFSAEVMSNKKFQDELRKIPYKKSNLFTEFARALINLLGLANSQQSNAFVESLLSVDRAMNTGRQTQEGKTGRTFEPPVAVERAEKEPRTKAAEREPRTRAAYKLPEQQKPKNVKYFHDLFFTLGGVKRIINTIQNSRVFAKTANDEADRAGLLQYGKEDMSNFYDWLTLSAGRAKTFYNRFVEEPYSRLNLAVSKLAKEKGVDAEEVLMDLHEYFEAKHEPERRMVKYIMTVPLTKDANTEREAIINELKTNTELTKEQAQTYRKLLDAIVSKNFDANGYSPPGVNLKKPTNAEQVASLKDPNSSYYNVVGLTPEEVQAKLDKFGDMNYLKEITSAMKDLHEATIDMNKESNYWSKPVDNLKNFYGFESYVPLKGLNLASETDENLDFSSARLSGELVKAEESFEGRLSVSNNPVLQTLTDAVQASMRAGRGFETTLSIKNAILQGIIPGSVNRQEGQGGNPISFSERTTSDILNQLKEDKGNKLILNYNSDGSIDVLQIDNQRILESIRRTYEKQNSLVDVANSITSTLGKMHTRYNFNFAPLNFVRDALTNAFNIGAKMGPLRAVEFLAKLTVDLATNGAMNKAFNVARLYSKPGGVDQIKALAEKTKDPVYQNMYEYINKGGMVEYLQGMSIKSNFDELNKRVGRSGIITKVEDFNKMIDIWNNMFEIASRSSAFGMMKSYYANEQKLDEAAAITKASAFVKNLANFEQVGTHGKALGAMFMFFRPSATGAVRALEAIAPALSTVEQAKARLPNSGAFAYNMVEGTKVYKNPKAIATWEKNYAFERKSAQYMAASLIALGWVMYNMSKMMAPDDDLGRNKTQTDNMDQWNRFARFHFPGTDKVFQVPWGFGLGAFAAAGAQLAAVAGGNGTMGDAMRNIFTQISLDSFVPIPVSRMKFSDDPLMWAVDSALPSFMRPAVEFSVNLNGIGQTIYNDSNRRMGDAYLGGDNIPQVYKEIAEYLNEKTLGAIDWSPNSLYFLTNSYMDGPARALLELPTNLYDLSSGRKEFTPKDMPFIGSFVSSESNIDAREFAEYEKDILKKEKIIKGFEENNPDRLDDYLDKYPFDDMLVKEYRHGLTKLNKLRKEANEIRRDYASDPKERNLLIKENKAEQNLYKNDLLDGFKSYKED